MVSDIFKTYGNEINKISELNIGVNGNNNEAVLSLTDNDNV